MAPASANLPETIAPAGLSGIPESFEDASRTGPVIFNTTSRRMPIQMVDWIVTALLITLTIVFVLAYVHFPVTPMEDAAMLLRYSQHLAHGHGITWNIGEHPVEGATDFLYMFLIGVFSWISRASVGSVASTILFLSHVASVAVLYLGLRYLYGATITLAACFAVVLSTGLGYHFIATGFSAPFYALFALLTWCAGMICVRYGVTKERAIWFGSLGFVTALIRPDGVVLAVLILCSMLYALDEGRQPLVKYFAIIFAAGGVIYFGWRLFYFGHLLPNPFYVKYLGDGRSASLMHSIRLYLEMMLPFLPLAGLGLRSREARQQMVMWLIPVAPFVALWMFFSQDNNHFSRFQYVVVPLSLMCLGGMAAGWWKELEEQPRESAAARMPLNAMMFLLFALAIFYDMHLFRAPYSNLGSQQVAERLKPYAAKHYTMMVTEPGDLPFYSEWRAIDAMGQNDASIAHHGGVMTEAYLEQNKPEVILYRDVTARMRAADLEAAAIGQVKTRDRLTLNALAMRSYAIAHGYVLAARWGAVFCDYHTYWVKPDFADRDAIVSAIRDHPYYTQITGQLSYDFRNVPDPSMPCTLKGN